MKDSKPPKTVSELRILLGLCNYCSAFVPNLATIAKPLRELTKNVINWNWEKSHDDALDVIKRTIITSCMAYFNKNWRTELTVDVLLPLGWFSPVGLGVVFGQYDPIDPSKKRFVRFESRTL